MYQRIKIQEEYALRPEGDGGCQQCDRDQGIEGDDGEGKREFNGSVSIRRMIFIHENGLKEKKQTENRNNGDRE